MILFLSEARGLFRSEPGALTSYVASTAPFSESSKIHRVSASLRAEETPQRETKKKISQFVLGLKVTSCIHGILLGESKIATVHAL